MKASLSEREPLRLKKWKEKNQYQKIRATRRGQEKYVLLDGPPYANGEIHIGHALNKILKDIVVKSQSLNGKDAAFLLTWDCHGLPIELNVEKKYGKVGQKIDPTSFRQRCREYASSQVEIQKVAFERLGIIADFEHPKLTMDFSYESNIIRLLGKVIENGHLARGYKPVHWCLDCGSSLAEAELEYKDKISASIEVKFLAENASAVAEIFKVKSSLPTSMIIWTTTPWTLPANQALCLGPEMTYVLIEVNGQENVLIAESLMEKVLARGKIQEHRVLARAMGRDLESLKFLHPFQARSVPVILGDHVTVEEGTGIVHTAPAHGLEDFEIGKKYGLPVENPVGENGCYLPNVPEFSGVFVRKADELIIERLRTSGALWSHFPLTHSYPHCWRHKTPLIFRATSQWFISMDQAHLRRETLAAIETVNWIPLSGKARILSMIQDRPDWCISRQRVWGTPIPLFLHKTTETLHPETLKILASVAKAVEQGGVEVWFENPRQFCSDENYSPVMDTVDVWFDSGASHFCLLEHESVLQFPANMYLEGSDQHRGWFQSSLLSSVAYRKVAPYREVLTHGFTVDDKGHKMSKSLGNVIAPEEIIKTFGADVLRLWVAGVDSRLEMVVSMSVFQQVAETYRRLRNTLRFLLANLDGFEPSKALAYPDLLGLDQWVLRRAEQLQKEVRASYDSYQFHHVVQKIHYFCSIELGGFYLDVIKDRQYTCQRESLPRRSVQTVMFHLLHTLVRALAPILSFTADEVWELLPGNSGELFAATWLNFSEMSGLKIKDESIQALMHLREEVNKEIEILRAAGKLGSSLEAEVSVSVDPERFALLAPLQEELRFALITSSAQISCGENRIQVKVSSHPKCGRCWHRLETVGKNSKHPELCDRCVQNVEGSGEVRAMV